MRLRSAPHPPFSQFRVRGARGCTGQRTARLPRQAKKLSRSPFTLAREGWLGSAEEGVGPIRCQEHIEETISLLSVPDTFATLAGGYQLAWRPVPGETAEAAVGVLAGLFAEHGAPLVLKTDNGSGLAAEPVRGLLQGHGVQALFSPPRTPQYNGSAEAGIGAVKVRTQERAERRGSPAEWSWEDIEGARQDGNAFGRSPLDPSRSPEQVWQAREPLRPQERAALAAEVSRIQAEVQPAEAVGGQSGGAEQEASGRAATWRSVLRRALGALGLLFIRWRRIS